MFNQSSTSAIWVSLENIDISSMGIIRELQKQPPEVFCKKDQKLEIQKIRNLRNFAKFTGKHLCQSQAEACNFIKKETQLAALLRKRLWHRCFTVNFAKFLRTPFLKKHLRWLLLELGQCTVHSYRFPDILVQIYVIATICSNPLVLNRRLPF